MESQYSHNNSLIRHILGQMIEACGLISVWNDIAKNSRRIKRNVLINELQERTLHEASLQP